MGSSEFYFGHTNYELPSRCPSGRGKKVFGLGERSGLETCLGVIRV